MLSVTCRRAIYEYRFGQVSLTRAFRPDFSSTAGYVSRIDAGTAIEPREAQCSTLSNGVRVVTHHMEGPHTVIGFYVDAGPKYDPPSLPGLSYVMRYALTTSNMENSLFQVDRAMRAVGAAYGHAEIQKRYLCWKMESRCDVWQRPFEMLATSLVAPRFHETDVERFRDTMNNQWQEQRWQRPREFAVDQLERVAFYKEPLGAPRMVSPTNNDRCSHSALLQHWATHFVPSRVILAGVNVDHEALVSAYETLPYRHSAEAPHHHHCQHQHRAAAVAAGCGGCPKKDADAGRHGAQQRWHDAMHRDEAAQFYPGREEIEYEARAAAMGTLPDMDAEVIAAVGVTLCTPKPAIVTSDTSCSSSSSSSSNSDNSLSSNGCNYSSNAIGTRISDANRDYMVACVVKELYSARMSSSYITRDACYHAPQVFYRPYASTGLIGFTLHGPPLSMSQQLRTALACFPSHVTDAELRAAQQRAQLRVLHEHGAMTRDYCDFIALASATASSSATPSMERLVAAAAEVSIGEVEHVLRHLLSQQPAVYVTGDTFTFPKIARLNALK